MSCPAKVCKSVCITLRCLYPPPLNDQLCGSELFPVLIRLSGGSCPAGLVRFAYGLGALG
eukprot:6478501-Amphidinium_carterae.1